MVHIFKNQKFITCGVANTIPMLLQIIMWELINNLPVDSRDYLQFFICRRILTGKFTAIQCYYIDRIRADKYYAKPQKLITKAFAYDEIIDVIASELDSKFYGINFINSLSKLIVILIITDKLL